MSDVGITQGRSGHVHTSGFHPTDNGRVSVGVAGGGAPTYPITNTDLGIAGETGFSGDRDEMWADMLAQGIDLKIVRLGLNWGTIEPNQVDGPTHWTEPDNAVQGALNSGLAICMNPNYAAATWTGGQFDIPGNISWTTFKNKYVAFMVAMVNRYHKNGSAKAGFIDNNNYVKYYEIYNEQNNAAFWHSTDNANGFGLNQPDPIRFAELMALTYDAIKDAVGADAIVGIGGFAVQGQVTSFKYEPTWLGHLMDWWDGNYTQNPDGWAKIPTDFLPLHPYDSFRFGTPGGAIPQGVQHSDSNFVTSVMCNKIPVCWNMLDNAGFGSLKMWGTEAGGAWRENAITGQGVRYGASSPAQTADEWKIYSPEEAYTHERKKFRIWYGLDPWPTASNFTRFNDQAGLSPGDPLFTTRATNHFGPLFYFGLRDHRNVAYAVPYTVDENYGLYKKSSPWSGPGTWALKRKTGSNNDVFEALLQF